MTTLAVFGISFYLGLLCAISPCPLATNIAAVGFVSRGASPRRTFLAGLFYALGRAIVYMIIAALLISLGVSKLNNVFNHLSVIERYFRVITGVVFLAVGIVLSIRIITSQLY